MNYAVVESPVGNLRIVEEALCIIELSFTTESTTPCESELLKECAKQLSEYFDGARKDFDLPLRLSTTEFRKKVYDELLKIPYGETITYSELAKRIGDAKAVRAVGGANHNNPIAIIIPCHRVIGKDGTLTGYGGGLKTKEFLLRHELKYK